MAVAVNFFMVSVWQSSLNSAILLPSRGVSLAEVKWLTDRELAYQRSAFQPKAKDAT